MKDDVFYWGNSPETLKSQIDYLTKREAEVARHWYRGVDNYVGLSLFLILCAWPLMILGMALVAVQIWGLS